MTVRLVACSLIVALVLPHHGEAQPQPGPEVASSFEELQRTLQPGETVYVTDARGAEARGRLVLLSGIPVRGSPLREASLCPSRSAQQKESEESPRADEWTRRGSVDPQRYLRMPFILDLRRTARCEVGGSSIGA